MALSVEAKRVAFRCICSPSCPGSGTRVTSESDYDTRSLFATPPLRNPVERGTGVRTMNTLLSIVTVSPRVCGVLNSVQFPPPDRPGNGSYWVGPHQCKPEFWTQLSVKWRLMTRLLGLGLVAGKLLRRWTEAGGGELPGGRMPLSPRCSRGVLPGDRQQLQRGDGPAACCIAVALEPRPSSRQLRSC